MAEIHTPVEGYTGVVAGVAFADGVGHTDDRAALAYFERRGYTVDHGAPAYPEGTPGEKWTVDQLKAYAADHDIDLTGVSGKDNIVKAVVPVEPATDPED